MQFFRLARMVVRVLAGLIVAIFTPQRVAAQLPSASSPYPLSDTPLTLPSGTVVRVRNLVVFERQGRSALTIYIETPTPSADSAKLAREARELVEMHNEFARQRQLSGIGVAVCRTRACVEMREAPSQTFAFNRVNDAWVVKEF